MNRYNVSKHDLVKGMFVTWLPYKDNACGGVYEVAGGLKTMGDRTVVMIKKKGLQPFDVDIKQLAYADLDQIKAHVGY